jgi:chromosome segregation ATPase
MTTITKTQLTAQLEELTVNYIDLQKSYQSCREDRDMHCNRALELEDEVALLKSSYDEIEGQLLSLEGRYQANLLYTAQLEASALSLAPAEEREVFVESYGAPRQAEPEEFEAAQREIAEEERAEKALQYFKDNYPERSEEIETEKAWRAFRALSPEDRVNLATFAKDAGFKMVCKGNILAVKDAYHHHKALCAA